MTPVRNVKVISPFTIWCLFGISIGAALFLIPRDDELFDRLLAGGKEDRAMAIAANSGSEEAERKRREWEQQKLAGSAPAVAANPDADLEGRLPSDALRFVLSKLDSNPSNRAALARVERVIWSCEGNRDDFEQLAARATELSPEVNEKFLGIVARKALGSSNPGFAAEVYTLMSKHVPSPSDETVNSMVLAYRYSAQPIRAVEIVESKLPEDGSVLALSEEMRRTLETLYFESSQPGRAYEVLREEIQSSKDSQKVASLMPRAVQAASYSGHEDELMPLFEQFLSGMPEAKLALPELVAAGRETERATEGNGEERPFVKFAKKYAQLSEWTGRYDAAFDHYCKAAALGDEAALQRCLDTYQGLFRHDDMAKLMAALAPFEGEKSSERTLKLAGLLGWAGRYEESGEAFGKYINQNPDDIDALVSMAALRAESGDLEAALETYRTAVSKRPEDVKLRMLTAEMHISLGQHEQAFALLRSIPESKHTDSTLEHFLLLAEALGDPKELNRGQRMLFKRQEVPQVDHYLDLAESYVQMRDTESELRVLRGGMAAKPKSQKIAMALADSLYREGDFAGAARLLVRPDLRSNGSAVALFIEICGGTDNFAYAARYLPPGVENRFQFSPSVRIELGQIYEESGDLSSAQQLYASVPEGREAWGLLASAKYKQGDLGRAEEYQLKFLRAAVAADADDWMFMGDIYKGLGKIRQADEAYRRSLSMMKSSL